MGFLYPTEDNLSERRRSDFNQWSAFIAFFFEVTVSMIKFEILKCAFREEIIFPFQTETFYLLSHL